jgi:hypothetical protein
VIVTLFGVKLIVAFTCTVTAVVVSPGPLAVMLAEPRFTPVMVGCALGAVCPAGIVILAVEIVTFEVSPLDRLIVMSAAAGLERLTAKVAWAPNPTVGLDGRVMLSGAVTTTLVVAAATVVATGVAVIVVGPGATDVIGTFTVVAPAAIVTLAGTVATPVLLDVRFTLRPLAGAADVIFKATFCVLTPVIVTVGTANVKVVVTFTAALADE